MDATLLGFNLPVETSGHPAGYGIRIGERVSWLSGIYIGGQYRAFKQAYTVFSRQEIFATQEFDL